MHFYRILGCGHTFCLSCINDMVENARGGLVECPLCGRPSIVPSNVNTSSDFPGLLFPENYSISESLLDIKPASTIACARAGCSNPATKYCSVCEKHLCESCAEFHSYFFSAHKCTPSKVFVANDAYIAEFHRVDRERAAELNRIQKEKDRDAAMSLELAAQEQERREREEQERRAKAEEERKRREEQERRIREEQERRRREEEERKQREEQQVKYSETFCFIRW